MQPFIHSGLPGRVLFGSGTLCRLGDEVRRLECAHALVLCTSGHAQQGQALADSLGPLSAGVFAGAVMHTPVDATEQALASLRGSHADLLVSIGGGSAIGLGKALALRTNLPQICIPTTYAGSEVTPVVGQTLGGRKTTQRSPAVLPKTVIYDVDLTLSLPAAVSAASGFNSMAHAIEALYARDANPLTSLLATQSIARMAGALPVIARDIKDPEARSEALYAAWLGGTCLASVGMALHHRLCHVLGGMFDMPHAFTHAALLPHTVAYNAGASPAAMDAVREALATPLPAPRALHELGHSLGIAIPLRELGMPEAGVKQAADEVCANPCWNPCPLRRDPVRTLLRNAWRGHAPHEFD